MKDTRAQIDILYDEVRDLGTQRFVSRKDADSFNYNIYEVFIEVRNFYLKKKLIFSDFIYGCNIFFAEYLIEIYKILFDFS